jgi:hypothetical protein
MAEKFDYAEAAQDATELLEEFGQVGAIRRTVSLPGPNEWTPGTTIETDYPIQVVVLPIDLQNVGRDLEGTLIKSTDKQLLIAAKDMLIIPTTTDIVLANGAFDGAEYKGGDAWIVSSVKTLAPAGKVVLYDAVATG